MSNAPAIMEEPSGTAPIQLQGVELPRDKPAWRNLPESLAAIVMSATLGLGAGTASLENVRLDSVSEATSKSVTALVHWYPQVAFDWVAELVALLEMETDRPNIRRYPSGLTTLEARLSPAEQFFAEIREGEEVEAVLYNAERGVVALASRTIEALILEVRGYLGRP